MSLPPRRSRTPGSTMELPPRLLRSQRKTGSVVILVPVQERNPPCRVAPLSSDISRPAESHGNAAHGTACHVRLASDMLAAPGPASPSIRPSAQRGRRQSSPHTNRLFRSASSTPVRIVPSGNVSRKNTGKAALGLSPAAFDLVLNHVPMFGQHAVCNVHDVRYDPVRLAGRSPNTARERSRSPRPQ